MDRHWDANGAASAPATPSNSLGSNVYPQGGAAPSQPGPFWFHQVTEEIRGVIVAAGITPSRGDLTQLADAIVALLTAGLANVGFLNVAQNWTKAQRGAVVALADGATITPDLALANNYSVTLAGNRTLANPSNIVVGQSGVIVVTQDGTGSRTLAYGSYYKFAGGVAPALTTTPGAIDHLYYYVESATRVVLAAAKDVK